MIKYFECCLYLRVERYKCYMCVSSFRFFYTFGICVFLYGVLGWKLIKIWYFLIDYLLYTAKISSIYYTNRIFLSNLSKKTHFEKKSEFFEKWTKLFRIFPSVVVDGLLYTAKNKEKILSISFKNLIFLSNLSKNSHFEKKIKFLEKWIKFSPHSQCSHGFLNYILLMDTSLE